MTDLHGDERRVIAEHDLSDGRDEKDRIRAILEEEEKTRVEE